MVPGLLLQLFPILDKVGADKFNDFSAHHLLRPFQVQHGGQYRVGLADAQVRVDNFLTHQRVFEHGPEPVLAALVALVLGLLLVGGHLLLAQAGVFLLQGLNLRLWGTGLSRVRCASQSQSKHQ